MHIKYIRVICKVIFGPHDLGTKPVCMMCFHVFSSFGLAGSESCIILSIKVTGAATVDATTLGPKQR